MSMPGSNHSRGGNEEPSPKSVAVHETVTYPRIKPATLEEDSCLNPNMAMEHLLACGHIVNTEKPDEPCAPNCYHAQHSTSKKKRNHARPVSEKDFYCNACVEAINEEFVPEYATSTQAGE